MNRSGNLVRRALASASLGLGALGAAMLLAAGLHLAAGWRAQSAARGARAGPVRPGQPWGRIEIPRVGLDLAVFEGVTPPTLRRGPGHVPGTAEPGLPGNCVIAGHRDSFFRSVSRLRAGDVVLLRGPEGSFSRYRLDSRRIVAPEEVSVLAPTPDRRLTLITCYPFRWIGPAPYRLVWTASPADPEALALSPATLAGARR